jgi:hypothetical protein
MSMSHSEGHIPQRPVFTVTTPINGVVSITMNFEMSQLLQRLVEDVKNAENEIEPELWSMARALKDPWGAQGIALDKRRMRLANKAILR